MPGPQEWQKLAKSGHKDEGWKSEIFRQRFVLVHLIAVMGHTGVEIKKMGRLRIMNDDPDANIDWGDAERHKALQLARQARNAEGRELRRAEYEANTTARKCLNCDEEFRSEGYHHRLCNRCRRLTVAS